MHADRIAMAAMAALLLLIVAFAFCSRWQRVGGMDSRTYFEMIIGVADHGLPSQDNGPAERFDELRARWNLPIADGTQHGNYPPAYPYLMAPLYRIGGLSAVVRATILTLALLALGAFALGRAVTGSPIVGAAAAWLSVLGSPLAVHALKPHSFVLATTCITWAVFLGLRAIRAGPHGHPVRWALAAGLVAGLGIATHLLVLPMAAALAAVVMWSLRGRGWGFLAGATVPLAAVALLNHVRFDSLSPFTYGPCVWRVCLGPRGQQTIANMLIHAWPAALWLAVAATLLLLLRRQRRAQLAAAAAALIAVLIPSLLQERVWLYLGVLWGVVVDLGSLPFDPPYQAAADGPGVLHGPFAVKSLLQYAPALALAPLARIPRLREKLLLGLPALALIAAVVLRANMSSEAVIGHSLLHIRYLLPGIPLLTILALAAVDWPRLRPSSALIAAQLGAVLAVFFAATDTDRSLLRRQVLLVVPLFLASLTAVWIALARRRSATNAARASAWPAVLLFAWGVAANVGIDLRHELRITRAVQADIPDRLGVVGWPFRLNPFLAIKDGRDVRHADLSELDDWLEVVRVIDYWHQERRPAYMLLPDWHRGGSPWPGYRFRHVGGTHRLAQVVRRSDSD
jgi:hypothetical protein